MDYLEYAFTCNDLTLVSEQLIALLSVEGYEGFVESEDRILAYLPIHLKDENHLERVMTILSDTAPIYYSSSVLPERNWNDEWEKDFEPIVIGTEVYIRASFHSPPTSDFTHSLLIDPKMSFGTGHHETTRLMIKAMLEISLDNKAVADIGCGTGILSILASKMGAEKVMAIDIDEWAYRNAIENIENNDCSRITVKQGSVEEVAGQEFDIVMANINRNVLLDELPVYYELLATNGHILMSGFRLEDENGLLNVARKSGLTPQRRFSENEWLAIDLRK